VTTLIDHILEQFKLYSVYDFDNNNNNNNIQARNRKQYVTMILQISNGDTV